MNEEHIIIMYLSLCKAFATFMFCLHAIYRQQSILSLEKKDQGSPKISTFWLCKQEAT